MRDARAFDVLSRALPLLAFLVGLLTAGSASASHQTLFNPLLQQLPHQHQNFLNQQQMLQSQSAAFVQDATAFHQRHAAAIARAAASAKVESGSAGKAVNDLGDARWKPGRFRYVAGARQLSLVKATFGVPRAHGLAIRAKFTERAKRFKKHG